MENMREKNNDEFSSLTLQQFTLLTIFVSAVSSIFVVSITVYALREYVLTDETIINRTINHVVERIIERPRVSGDETTIDRDQVLTILKETSATLLQKEEGENVFEKPDGVLLSLERLVRKVQSARVVAHSNLGEAIQGFAVEGGIIAVDIDTGATIFTKEDTKEEKTLYQKKETRSPYTFFAYSDSVSGESKNISLPLADLKSITLGTRVVTLGFNNEVEQLLTGYVSRIVSSGFRESRVYMTVVFETGRFPSPSTPVLTEKGELIGIYATVPRQIVVPLEGIFSSTPKE